MAAPGMDEDECDLLIPGAAMRCDPTNQIRLLKLQCNYYIPTKT